MIALLAQGANEHTFEELRRGLHFLNNKSMIADQFGQYFELLRENTGTLKLTMANRIYVQEGYQIENAFRDIAFKTFSTDIDTVDFTEKLDAVDMINDVVARKTDHKIQYIIKPDMINRNTRVILLNVLCLKGEWRRLFHEKHTKTGDFHVSQTDSIRADFMHQNDFFNFAELDTIGAKALEMKYFQSKLSFVIILPNRRHALLAVERKLKNFDLIKIMEQMREKKVQLYLPRFRIEFDISLKGTLENVSV